LDERLGSMIPSIIGEWDPFDWVQALDHDTRVSFPKERANDSHMRTNNSRLTNMIHVYHGAVKKRMCTSGFLMATTSLRLVLARCRGQNEKRIYGKFW
jgi:ribosomal protein L34